MRCTQPAIGRASFNVGQQSLLEAFVGGGLLRQFRFNNILVKYPRLVVLSSLIALAGVCVVNYWIFRTLLNVDYVRWYVTAGPFIGIATAVFAAAWGNLDRNVGLISVNPLDYAGSCMQVAGLPIFALGGHLQTKNQPNALSVWDSVIILPVTLVVTVSVIGWLLLIAPIQYFVFLICGAPSRAALSSSLRVYSWVDGNQVRIEELTERASPPKEWWDSSMRDKPVTLTSAFAGAALFLVGWLWA